MDWVMPPAAVNMVERVRVLHPITRLIVGGAQENTLYTAERLDRARYQVEVLSGPQTGSEGSLIEEARARGIPLTILPELVRQVNPGRDLAALVKLARFMRAGRYTIVHTHSSKAGVLGRVAAYLAGVPVIVHTVHGWSFHNHMSRFRRAFYICLERLGASLCQAMVVVTLRDIEKGLSAGIGAPERYHLIRSAIPLDEFDPARVDRSAVRSELGIPLDAPVLGNIGRFSEQKNPLDWVRIAGDVGRALPECRFLLVGDGPLRAQVKEQLEFEGLTQRTILTGLRRDVPRLLGALDVFLLTSRWEGLPRVIPQAMAMGLPVVATRADGSVEAINHGTTGYLAETGDIEALSAYCIELLVDPEARRRMGQRGREYAAREFDLERMLAQIDDLYAQLLQDHGL